MTITIWDAVLPIICFMVFAVVTVPVVSLIRRKAAGNRALLIVWFLVVFVTGSLSVLNLALKYYLPLATSYPSYPLPNTDPSASLFSSAFLIDTLSIFMAIIFTAISAIVFLYGVFAVNTQEKPVERYFGVMLAITGGVIGATFAGDFLTLFIFWEISAGSASFLMLYEKTTGSIRATLKYLIIVIIASSFIVFGLSIIFGVCGTLTYAGVSDIIHAIGNPPPQLTITDQDLLIFAFILVATGYATEAAVVPFHMWLPDAYTAAPATSSSFISSVIDQGSYYILLRVFVYVLTPPLPGSTLWGIHWQTMMGVLAALTVIIANLSALAEKNIKRIFAYICIADVGYNLIAITSVSPLGILGNLYFFLNGGITIALAFMVVGIFNAAGIKTLDDLHGIGRKMPFTSIALVAGTLSFAGIPPLAGFIAKYLVFTAAIEANMAWLAIIGVLTSVIQAGYLIIMYSRMYAKGEDEPEKPIRIKEPLGLLIPIYILLGAIILFGILPQLIFYLIVPVANQFPYPVSFPL